MLNKLIIDVNTASRCDCAESIDIGVNMVIIEYKRTHFDNPKIQFTVFDKFEEIETIYEHDLTVSGNIASFVIPNNYISIYGTVKFKYIDTEYDGTVFTIYTSFPNGIPYDKNLCMNKINDFEYKLTVISKEQVKGIDTNNGGFDITDDGKLTLETPINVTCTINSDDQITNVDFEYKDDYHKSFSIEWDPSTGKITKFGNLPINWE